ncbi:hypothetical protein MTO96_048991 [Rhipicephalus appendiculatus]
MPANNREWTTADSGDDVACLRPTTSTTSGPGGLRSRAVQSRRRTRESPTAAQEPPPWRIPAPLLEEVCPNDAMKLRYRVRKRVFSILLVALSCAMVLLVAGISMYVVGWYDSVAVWLVSVGVAIELASCFLYCCNIHEKSRALLATVLLSEAEWDAPTPAEGGNGRVPNEDDGGDHVVPTCLTGDAYLDAIM